MKIKELLTDKSKWTKGRMAQDSKGNTLYAWDIQNSNDIACFCLMGAVIRCYGSYEDYFQIRNLISREINMHPIDWNDAEERTFEQVKELVERLDI